MGDRISKTWITIGILAILLISACSSQQPADAQTISNPYENTRTEPPKEVAVSQAAKTIATQGSIEVKDTIVTQEQVQQEYAKAPAYVKEQISQEQYADLLINKELLKAQASKQGLVPDKTTTQTQLQAQLQTAGISENDFEKQLQQQFINKETFLEEYAIQQAIFALVTQHTPKVEVSDQEARDYLIASEPIVETEIAPEELEVLTKQVKRKLEQEQQKQALIDYVNQLRRDANIEPLP